MHSCTHMQYVSMHTRVGQYFNISAISGNLGHAIMISQAFSQVNNIACAIYRKISLNIAVGYCRIECTASTIMLKTIYSMAFIIFTTAKYLMQYSNNRNIFCCNDRNTLFQYRPTLMHTYCMRVHTHRHKHILSDKHTNKHTHTHTQGTHKAHTDAHIQHNTHVCSYMHTY